MFSSAGVWPLIDLHDYVNANDYQNPIVFMRDNEPFFTAKWVKKFLEAEHTEIMKC